LETHIFTTTPTFHGTSIGNHDLKIVDYMDIEMGSFRNALMNEIMSETTINYDDDLPFFKVVK